MIIYFDSKDEYCKSPFGAVEESADVYFRAGVARRGPLKDLWLVIGPEHGETERIRGSWADLVRGLDYYAFEWTAKAADLYFYRFEADLSDGKTVVGKACQLTVWKKGYTVPGWLGHGVMYQIFPDRFARSDHYQIPPVTRDYKLHSQWGELPDYKPDAQGVVRNNDFFGGNLRGILEKLPYLADLGVTVLYLNPIVEAFSNHRYDTADFKNVDPILGTIDDFRLLCREAEGFGIRILLDGVFNHTGSDSIYFNKYGHYPGVGAYQSKASKYYPWYHFVHYPDNYDAWWGIDTLPHVRELEESYLDYVIRSDDSVVRFWLDCGASGFRVDVADELPSEFLRLLRKTVKDIKPDAAIIGEVWEDASNKISYGVRRHYLQGEELDSVMNYPLKDALIRYLAYDHDAEAFAAVVSTLWENYPPMVFTGLMNILGTHDTARILSILGHRDALLKMGKEEKAALKLTGEQRRKARALLHLALMLWAFMPGIPCIYYGDEIGMEGAEDPLNRKCFNLASADRDIQSFYKKILAFRRTVSDIGQYAFRPEISRRGLYVFSRSKDEKSVAVAVNAGAEAEEITLNLGEDGRIIDWLDSGGCSVSDTGRVLLQGVSGVVLLMTE